MFSTPRKTHRRCYYSPYANAQAFSLPRPRYRNLFANTFKINIPKPNPVLETPLFARGPQLETPPLIPTNPLPPYSPFPPPPRKRVGLNFGNPCFEKPPVVPDNPAPPYSPFPPPPRRPFGRNPDYEPPIEKSPPIPADPVHPAFPPSPNVDNLDEKPKPFAFFPGPGPKRTKLTSLRRLKSFKLRPAGYYGRIRVRAPYPEPRRRPIEDRGQLNQLDAEIERVFKDDLIDPEDQIFLKQMARLNMNRAMRTNLRIARQVVDRAVEMKPARIKEREKRDALLEKKREEKRLREEALRLEEERKKKEEEERRERLRLWDEQMKKEREERMRRVREDRERWEKKRAARREAEERRRLAEEERRKEAARLKTEQAADIKKLFANYDLKWQLLKCNVASVTFADFPWPVLDFVSQPDDITYLRVKDFVFHLSRTNLEGKSRKDRVRAEMLKWHPDKFETKMPKVMEWDKGAVKEGAGRVARFLNQMMEGIEMEVQGT